MLEILRKTVVSAIVLVFVAASPVPAEQKAENDKTPSTKPAQEHKRAKDIFYMPDPQPITTTPEHPLQLALKYKIFLDRPGQYTGFVPESFVFQEGDRFRIIFEGNAAGYLYIFNKGTSGRGVVLFPDKRINHGINRIPTHVEAVIPATGWYVFDDKPGTEELYIFYTPRKIQDLEAPIASGVITETFWQQTITTIFEHRMKSVKKGTTKDIVYVEEGMTILPIAETPPSAQPIGYIPDPQPNIAPATFAATQTTEGDGLLIHTIKLNHK